MKRTLLLISLSFVIALTVMMGWRVSADALAVIVGVILGIVASVPTTILVIFVMTRQQNRFEKMQPPAPQHPPVIVVNGADKAPGYPPSPALPTPYGVMSNGTRQWTVIGGVETEE